jgi:hypothetical protein
MTAAKLAERTAGLVRVCAAAAVIGGVLRIASTFIPYEANSAPLETLYLVIDVCLLFGLVAIYIANAGVVGLSGLGLFLVSLAGIASIVGPDTQAFGIDFYRIGALVYVAGLAGLSVQLLRARRLVVSAGLWVVTLGASLLTAVVPEAFMAAGVALGAGYVLAGVAILRVTAAPRLTHQFS